MKLNIVFTIAAILLIFMSVMAFFTPPALAGTTDVAKSFDNKISGVLLVSLGIIAWLVRNAEASKTRDSVVLGYTILFTLWAVVSVYGSFLDMPYANISWIIGLIQALVAVGFFIAGKASMSKAEVAPSI
jgi:hypothetical protein